MRVKRQSIYIYKVHVNIITNRTMYAFNMINSINNNLIYTVEKREHEGLSTHYENNKQWLRRKNGTSSQPKLLYVQIVYIISPMLKRIVISNNITRETILHHKISINVKQKLGFNLDC